jgi:hypothetical protein
MQLSDESKARLSTMRRMEDHEVPFEANIFFDVLCCAERMRWW